MVDQYIYSGSLPENASTYVTRAADRELYIGLKEGKFCYVLNSRQSGKSSLRVRTMQRLRNDGVECAAIDLSAGGIQNVPPEQWYADLIDTLIDSFGLDVDFGDWWSEISDFTLVKRFRKFIEEILLAEIQENIVIFIDEIDSVISLNFPTDDFFAFIRACYNLRVDNPEYKRLTFCLLGVSSPGNLIKDKNRTPFNIGKAISLVGFKLDEVEPLIKGLEGKFSDSQGVIAEILNWTGGQPFLTQKLCQFMVEESEQENPRTVAEVVKSRIIENWESQDEPEHLRTIRARILRNEERAGYLLELYQQIWRAEVESSITGDDTIEQSELLLSGLVARREGKLRVYNAIYKEVFNLNWVENELNNLRPYSEAFRAWVASGYSDESRLLGGKALEGAEKWAKGKNLSYQDKQFLAASKEKEIAVRNKEAELERERKDREAELERERKDREAELEREREKREAAEQRNQVLSEANKKAKQQIRNGTVVLVVAVLGAVISVTIAAQKVLEARTKLEETYTYVAYPQQLTTLAGKLSSEPEKASEISKKATIKIKDPQLEQVYLHASKSLAYQYLEDRESAEESIKQSMKFLRGWKVNKGETEHGESNSEFLQTKIFALTVQGNLFRKRNNTQQVREAYSEAFNILQKHKINPFNPEFSILNKNTVEDVHRGLIESLDVNKIQGNPQLDQVRTSLVNYYLQELNNLLSNKKWREADEKTWRLMLYVANRENPGYFDLDSLKNFSCKRLKDMDSLWVQHSNRRFGFSVQKQIWKDTGNRLGIDYGEWTQGEQLSRFMFRVGWYNNESGTRSIFISYSKLISRVVKDYQQAPVGILPGTGLKLGVRLKELGYEPGSQLVVPIPTLTTEQAAREAGLLFSRVATCKV
ncbi:MAG: GUN4 domain-containing protein [Calothrix sp. MO_167.B12]|nr:GUN4 domain-containing protein [Calothrix sp. MO_167.B12]